MSAQPQRWLGKKPAVTEAQYRTIMARYQVYLANRPGRIARDLGLTAKTVSMIGTGRGPKRYGGNGHGL